MAIGRCRFRLLSRAATSADAISLHRWDAGRTGPVMFPRMSRPQCGSLPPGDVAHRTSVRIRSALFPPSWNSSTTPWLLMPSNCNTVCRRGNADAVRRGLRQPSSKCLFLCALPNYRITLLRTTLGHRCMHNSLDWPRWLPDLLSGVEYCNHYQMVQNQQHAAVSHAYR